MAMTKFRSKRGRIVVAAIKKRGTTTMGTVKTIGLPLLSFSVSDTPY